MDKRLKADPSKGAQVNAVDEGDRQARLFITFMIVAMFLAIGFVGWTILTAEPGPEVTQVDCPTYSPTEPDLYPLVCLS